MPTINYQTKLTTSKYEQNISHSYENMRFGNRPKETSSEKTIIDFTKNPQSMTDGWLKAPEISEDNLYISISDESVISNNRVIRPSLNGPSVSAVNETRLDNSSYELLFGSDPVLGAKSIGSGSNNKAFIFRRRNGKVEVYREYSYIRSALGTGLLDDDQFTEIEVDGQNYVLFNLRKPIPISQLRGSNAEVGINDYLPGSFSYDKLLFTLNLSEDNFLECCDYTSIEDLKIQSWDVPNTEITLSSEYFPIYTHVTVVVEMELGLIQLGVEFAKDVDSNRGTVRFNGAALKNTYATYGEVKGFYLYYGVVPSVYLDSQNVMIRDDEILSKEIPLSYIGINDREQEGHVTLSEPRIDVIRDIEYSSISTDLYVPERYKSVFLEPASTVMINGRKYSAGNRMFLNNSGVTRLEFSAPNHVFDLVEQAVFISDNLIQLQSPLVGEAVGIYGLFDYTDVQRLTLMASYGPSFSNNAASLDAVGYGEGSYSAGGFGQGQLVSYNSTVTYNLPSNSPFQEYNRNMSVQVIPDRDGFEFILPAWTRGNTISVIETGARSSETFVDWEFIAPDVLILNKDKVDRSRQYNIIFEAIASPVIPEVNLNNNTVNVIIDSPPENIYPGYRGTYILGPKQFQVRIGYINSLGGRSYFSNEITIQSIVTKEYLQKTITGFKSIIF